MQSTPNETNKIARASDESDWRATKSMIQVQMRDISGFIETRNTLLAGKSSQRNNWISFAIAHHLDRNYTLAAQVHVVLARAHDHGRILVSTAEQIARQTDVARLAEYQEVLPRNNDDDLPAGADLI